jgi:hypothetical protein
MTHHPVPAFTAAWNAGSSTSCSACSPTLALIVRQLVLLARGEMLRGGDLAGALDAAAFFPPASRKGPYLVK